MNTNSLISGLVCPKCGKRYSHLDIHNLCECGFPLLVEYYLDEKLDRKELIGRPASLWRYKEVLPVLEDENIVSLGEGFTPLIPLTSTASKYGVKKVFLKDEGIIPTGTFKARGAAVGVSKAKELKISEVAMPTNGNAGAAWAIYSARAGIKTHIVMPEDSPFITRNEIAAAGAEVHLVRGLINECGKIVARLIPINGWYDVSTLKEPYRVEGKKTMGYEIAEQLGWKMPDVILYPTGGGVGIIGIYKAFKEMKQLGWIDDKPPRLVAVQAAGCAPIVEAFKNKAIESEFFPNSKTAAFGINVPKALGDFLVLAAVYETNGCAVAVEEADILNSIKEFSALEGTFVCPEGGAVFAGFKKLRAENWIGSEETAVLLNTGMGIKYPDILKFKLDYIT
jgi:threonine synthase